MIIALKNLFKDSVVYGTANIIQKLTPVVIIPMVIAHLGDNALKLYDLSFIYVYLFSTLVIFGLDSAGSVFYFDQKTTTFSKQQVISYALYLQLFIALFYLILFYPFRHTIANIVFPNDPSLEKYWIIALSIIPGYIMFNYGLNVLLWQKKKKKYVGLCLLHSLLNISSVYTVIVLMNGSISQFFYALIGSMTLCGLVAMLLLRKQIFVNPFPLHFSLAEKLVVFGSAFALTSFFRQVIPSIDRFFLLRYHYNDALPQYILAVKLASFINIGFAAFVLAFTPYSLNKLNHDDAEKEISAIFRIVTIIAFTMIPTMLVFKDGLIHFFADRSYALSTRLLPLFLFGWVFDLFTNFAFLGVYKSQKSYFILALLMAGTVIVCVLDILLVPKYGIYGAATSFLITKMSTFFIAFFYMRKHFKIDINIYKLLLLFFVTAVCSYLTFIVPLYQYLILIVALITAVCFYLYRIFKQYQLGSYFQ